MYLAALAGGAAAAAPAPKPLELPRVEGVEALASVNDEPISLDDYLAALAEMHAEAREGGVPVARKDPMELLERLIGSTLVLQEARAIGLHETPEYLKAVEQYREDELRVALFEHVTKSVPPPDPAKVEAEFRPLVEEVELASVFFKTRESADAFADAVKAGGEFTALAAQGKERGTAFSTSDPTFIKRSHLLPEIVAAIQGLAPGAVSAPIVVSEGFGVVRYLGVRYPENAEARVAAENKVAAEQANAALKTYAEDLRAKNVKTDSTLVDSLEFDVDAQSFERFLSDERVLVTFEGGSDPIRVRNLAQSLKNRQFHGVERAAEKGRLGKMKWRVLDNMTLEKMFHDEALRLKLDQDPSFLAAQQDYEDSILFGSFVTKAIDSSINVSRDEVVKYYETHKSEYTSPEMIRLDVVSFVDASSAQHALERLNAGADMAWVAQNAEGRFDRSKLTPESRYEGRVLMIDALPSGLVRAIAGAESGSYRLWEESPARYDIVRIQDRVLPKVQAFEEIEVDVARKVYNQRRNDALREWENKLRAASEVRVFVNEEQLTRILGQEPGATAPPANPR